MSESVSKARGLLDLAHAINDVASENERIRASYANLKRERRDNDQEKIARLDADLFETRVRVRELTSVLAACWRRLGGSASASDEMIESCIEHEIERVMSLARPVSFRNND